MHGGYNRYYQVKQRWLITVMKEFFNSRIINAGGLCLCCLWQVLKLWSYYYDIFIIAVSADCRSSMSAHPYSESICFMMAGVLWSLRQVQTCTAALNIMIFFQEFFYYKGHCLTGSFILWNIMPGSFRIINAEGLYLWCLCWVYTCS